MIQVHPLSEVRQRLPGILARFRREGAAAEPVAFGSHRRPEAILLPYEVHERCEARSRQHARLDSALVAAQSVQVELPGPVSPDHDREVAAYVAGEISAAELYRRTAARYLKPYMPGDPYSHPVTGVLPSKLGLNTAAELEAAEREITHAAPILLHKPPDPPSYDLPHLREIHQRIFGGIYERPGAWQHLDAARNVEASAAIMRGNPEPMRKMLDALVRDGT
jgi:hypothetical protein